MQPRPRPTAVAVLGALVMAAGCGSESADPPGAQHAGGAEWTSQALDAQPGADAPRVLAADGDQVVIVTTSEDGVIAGFAADGTGPFEAGEPTATGLQALALGGAARYGDRWVSVGSGGVEDREGGEGPSFEVHAFTSADGRTWAPVDATGLTGSAEVGGVAATDGAVVAVGTLRAPSGGIEAFRPVAWRSTDGEAWAAVELPTAGDVDGSAQSVVAVGDRLLAAGRDGDRGALWSSDDGGTSWGVVDAANLPPTSDLAHLAADGGSVVASGMRPYDPDDPGGQVVLVSTDAGRRWREAGSPPPASPGEGIAFPVSAGGGRFFAVSYAYHDAGADPGRCYANIDLCRQDSAVTLYVSDDGDTWARVDRAGIGRGEAAEVDDAVATDGGRVVAVQRAAEGVVAWVWPPGAPLPTTGEPDVPTPDVEFLAEGTRPEVGRRYAAPLYIHCGMDWLYLGGEAWERTDSGRGVETGAGDPVPDDWPVAQQAIFGFATLVEDGVVEYTIGDGEVIATFGPPTREPPGCD